MPKTQMLATKHSSSPSDIGAIKAAVEEIAPKYNITRVFLFGSFARCEAGSSSDIDLCLETFRPFSYFDAGGFGYEMTEKLGREVDLVSEEFMFPHVRESMLKDRILLYERQ